MPTRSFSNMLRTQALAHVRHPPKCTRHLTRTMHIF